MGCCKAKEEEEAAPKKLNDRGCTDVICCLFFAVFWAGLIVIFVIANNSSDPYALLYDADYLGNRCGRGNFSTRSKAFYPRMADDLYEQRAYLLSGAVYNIKMYTLCVEDCPTAFSVDEPTIIRDYGYEPASEATQALGRKTQAEWVSVLPTYDVLNRCIPYSESEDEENERCAYPDCNATEVVAVGGACEAGAEPAGSWTMETPLQKAACLVKVTKVSGVVYTMQTSDEVSDASETLLEYIAKAAGFLNDVISSLRETALYLTGFGLLLPIVLSFAYALFLRFFAKVAIYTMLVLLVIAMLLVTIICYIKAGLAIGGVSAADALEALQNATAGVVTASFTVTDPTLLGAIEVETGNTDVYEVGFWVMLLLDVFAVFVIVAMRHKLRMAIAIVQEACAVFRTMPSLMLFPFSTVFADVLVCTFFLVGAFLIATAEPESFQEAMQALNNTLSALDAPELMGEYASGDTLDDAASLSASATAALAAQDGETLLHVFVAYWLFGFLWTLQFVQAIAWTAMSGAVCYWYFFRRDEEERSKAPILRSVLRVVKYHLGSMAFGALIIAICQFVRLLMEWLDQQTKQLQEANLLLRLTLKCTKCCLWCFEKTVRFVTGYGFVYVALEGTSFCMACYKTFRFVLANVSQVGINTLVSKLLTLLAMVAIPVGCSAAAFAYFENVLELRNPMYPTFFVLVVSAVVSNACASVFECTITTIFVCCFRDNELYDGRFMSRALREAFGLPKRDGSAEDADEDTKLKQVPYATEETKGNGKYDDGEHDQKYEV